MLLAFILGVIPSMTVHLHFYDNQLIQPKLAAFNCFNGLLLNSLHNYQNTIESTDMRKLF